MKEKYFLVLTIFISALNFIFICYAQQARTITITSPQSGQIFSAGELVFVSGTATVSGGDEHYDHYGVTVIWGEGIANASCIPVNSTWGWSTNSSNSYGYATAGHKTIIVKLYHLCEPGKEPANAEATSTAEITILSTCGIIVIPSTLNFMSVEPRKESDEMVLIVNNTGTTTALVTVNGNDWTGASILLVNRTAFSTSSGNYDSKIQLSSSPQTIISSLVPATPINTYWQFKPEPGDSAGNYTQIITFTSSC